MSITMPAVYGIILIGAASQNHMHVSSRENHIILSMPLVAPIAPKNRSGGVSNMLNPNLQSDILSTISGVEIKLLEYGLYDKTKI